MQDSSKNSVQQKALPRRRQLSAEDYIEGIRRGDRGVLAQAITLVESNIPEHQRIARVVLDALIGETGKSVRVGITGVPGAGKSTLIEALGGYLCTLGHRVAVLAVDPSSTVTRGSILGDKTRMELLSRNPAAFIRPSPTAGTLGGVARKSRETLLLCEAFGFDVILLETVGVGQSEVTVRSMVDCFILLQIAGAGDELQGIKKGVVEIADLIVINKADGDNLLPANRARAEFERVVDFLHPATEGWKTRVLTTSAMKGEGLDRLWESVQDFIRATQASSVFNGRRQQQNIDWLHSMIEDALKNSFYGNPEVRRVLDESLEAVRNGRIPATSLVSAILAAGGVAR